MKSNQTICTSPEGYVVSHGKRPFGISDKEYQIKFGTGRDSQKDLIIRALQKCFRKANSKETFYKLLWKAGIKTYDRGGKITGVKVKNY